jgi:hypothetical protein
MTPQIYLRLMAERFFSGAAIACASGHDTVWGVEGEKGDSLNCVNLTE